MGAPQAISDPVLHILLALSDRPRHGYAIMQEIEERTEGEVEVGTGTLYTALKRLRSDGLIVETDDPDASEDGRPKRTYTLTTLGRATLAEQVQRLRALVSHASQKKVLTEVEAPV